jgi:endonuclease YncB( thermonuclease family)
MKTPAFIHSQRRRRQILVASVAILLVVSVLDHLGVFGFTDSDRERFGFRDGMVVSALDSNTIEVDLLEVPHTLIRLAGVDCPLSSDYFGPQAATYVQSQVVGKRVRVILDPNHRVRDHEGRLLAYLYFLPSGEMVNQALIDAGLGYADLRLEHVLKHSFVEHEKKAAKSKTGLWAGVTPEQMPEWRQRMSNSNRN